MQLFGVEGKAPTFECSQIQKYHVLGVTNTEINSQYYIVNS